MGTRTRTSVTELESDARQQLVASATAETQQLNNWFRATDRHLSGLTRTTAVRTENLVDVADRFYRTLNRDGIIGVYYLDTANDTTLVQTGTDALVEDGGQLNASVAERITTANEASSRTVTYSRAFRLPGTGTPAVLAVAAPPPRDDRFVVAVVALDELSTYLLADRERTTVVDATGTVVLATDESDLLTSSAVSPTAFESETGFVSDVSDEEGTDLVVGYAGLDRRGWTAATAMTAREAYSLQTDVSRHLLVILGVTSLGLVAVGLTLGRDTVREVRSLSATAERLQDGRLDGPIETDRNDELGDLARAFESMRGSLRERIREAETARKNAEASREQAEEARQTAERARRESKELTQHLERTATEYGETMAACADGDLARRLDPDERSAAMAEIADSFNEMMDELEATVEATRTFAAAVDSESVSAADAAVEAADAGEEVSRSVPRRRRRVRAGRGRRPAGRPAHGRLGERDGAFGASRAAGRARRRVQYQPGVRP